MTELDSRNIIFLCQLVFPAIFLTGVIRMMRDMTVIMKSGQIYEAAASFEVSIVSRSLRTNRNNIKGRRNHSVFFGHKTSQFEEKTKMRERDVKI
jgi:hypothetical protein